MEKFRAMKSKRPIGKPWIVQLGHWRIKTSNRTGIPRRVFVYRGEWEYRTKAEADAAVVVGNRGLLPRASV